MAKETVLAVEKADIDIIKTLLVNNQ